MSILLTGRRVEAAELYRFGVVNEVVPAGDLDESVNGWLEQICACAPTSIRAIKQIVNRTGHMTAREARTTQVPALIDALTSVNATEGVEAFQQKRQPNWSDK